VQSSAHLKSFLGRETKKPEENPFLVGSWSCSLSYHGLIQPDINPKWLVLFQDPNNPSTDRFQYPRWGCLGLGTDYKVVASQLTPACAEKRVLWYQLFEVGIRELFCLCQT